jgi:hypothetical protein
MKGERHHFKKRAIQMEVILNLCANKEVVHKNNARRAWCAHDWAQWGKNHKSGRRKEFLLARNEVGCKAFCVHLC